jgi:hypothetical protein
MMITAIKMFMWIMLIAIYVDDKNFNCKFFSPAQAKNFPSLDCEDVVVVDDVY